MTRFIPKDVIDHNRRVEQTLERRLGMTLLTYKTIEAAAELALIALAFYTVYQGGDPMTVFILTAVAVGGWKVAEFLAVYADDIQEAAEFVQDATDDED